MSVTLTDGQNAAVGFGMGVVEISAMQPMNYWKNARQQSLPLSCHPRLLYRGYVPSALNMSCTTMAQCAIAGKVKQWLTGGDIRALSPGEHLLAGVVGGVASAPLITSPLELLMTQQQRKGGHVVHHLRQLAGRNLMRGAIPTMGREGVWATAYLVLPSVLRPYLRHSFPHVFPSDTAAMVPTSLLAAGFACALTQPLDTIKTCMQGDVEQVQYRGFVDTIRKLFHESGVSRFYRGTAYRYGRMVGGVFLMDKVRMHLTRWMEEVSV